MRNECMYHGMVIIDCLFVTLFVVHFRDSVVRRGCKAICALHSSCVFT